MKIKFDFAGHQFECSTADGTSLAIPLDFNGPQPNFYGTPKANKSALKLGEFVGDTSEGGSCNVDQIQLIPHCTGTHTETIGHIVDQEVFVSDRITDHFFTASLITVEPQPAATAAELGETYRPKFDEADRVLSRSQLEKTFTSLKQNGMPGDGLVTDSLIVRTSSDKTRIATTWDADNRPAFFTVDAIELLIERGYQHLLIDLPSVDRMNDDGLLTNHHLFWNVQEGSHELMDECCQDKTISEMIFVPESVADGFYLLNIQVPAFCSDAAPSRPVIYKPIRIDN